MDPIQLPEVLPIEPEIPQPKSKKKLIIFSIIIFLVVLLLFSGIGLTVAVAYEKLTFGESTDQKIRHTILAIPFMPKTTRYVLEKTFLAHKDSHSLTFDASISMESVSFASWLGLNPIDWQLKGVIDYKDLENIQFDVESNITKEFNAYFRKIDSEVFIKVNKVPVLVSSLFGFNGEQIVEILGSWIIYDVKPPDTQAHENLVEALTDEQIVKKIDLSMMEENGLALYVLKYVATDEDLDYFDQKQNRDSYKLRDVIDKLEVEVKIGQKDGLVRSISTLTEVNLKGSVENLKATFVLKLDNFNEEIKIDKPEGAIDFEEFFEKSFNKSLEEARDKGRLSSVTQMGHALEAYSIFNDGRYIPSTNQWITALVDSGEISGIPSEINYEFGSACSYNNQNNICYRQSQNLESSIVYSKLESSEYNALCDGSAGCAEGDAYALYSSIEGKGGIYCSLAEPEVVSSELVFCESK